MINFNFYEVMLKKQYTKYTAVKIFCDILCKTKAEDDQEVGEEEAEEGEEEEIMVELSSEAKRLNLTVMMKVSSTCFSI